MKLNDPFGRLESRHQRGYESMRAVLQEAGISTPGAAARVIRQAWIRGVTVLAVGLSLLILISLLLPKAAPLAMGLGIFLVVWVTTSSINGWRYIKRYIDEELER